MTIQSHREVTIQTPHGDAPRPYRFVFADYTTNGDEGERWLEYNASNVPGDEPDWRLCGGVDGPHYRVSWVNSMGVGCLLVAAQQSHPPYWLTDRARPKDDVLEFHLVTAFRREDESSRTYFYVDLLHLGRKTRGDLKKLWGR